MAIRVPLQLHADSRCAVKAIEVEVARLGPRRVELVFYLTGGIEHVVRNARHLRDELWKSTCFELFLKPESGEGYFEVNLAPDGAWMVFRFAGYRAGRSDVEDRADVRGEWVPGERRDPFTPYPSNERWEDGKHRAWVRMTVDLERFHDLPDDRPWHLGISAVIEEKSGRKAYWALAHPPEKPDFHDPACFALELPAARAA